MKYRYNDGSNADVKIKLLIPILVKWVQESWDLPLYYSDLAKKLNTNKYYIGHLLGLIYTDVINAVDFPNVPILNCLVCNKNTKLPGSGIKIVEEDYKQWSNEQRKAWVNKCNRAAHEFNWNPVLKKLGLKPIPVIKEKRFEKYRNEVYHSVKGGESELHKNLKNYILKHPKSIGINSPIIKSEVEYRLMSQDEIDVLFTTKNDIYAVEVKSEISNDADIVRGLFQAVKYKSLLEAQGKVNGDNKYIHSILVIGRSLHKDGKEIAKILDIDVLENFKSK